MPLIQKCLKSWSVWEEMGNPTPTPPWCWQKSHTGHLPSMDHMPSLCCLTSQGIFTTGLPGRKQDRLMTSQAKVWKNLELSWDHNRKVTEHDHWSGHYLRWPVLSLLYTSSCYSVSVTYSKVRPILDKVKLSNRRIDFSLFLHLSVDMGLGGYALTIYQPIIQPLQFSKIYTTFIYI